MKQSQTLENSSQKLAERRKLVLALMLIAIAAWLAYINTLNNEFVFDDVKIIRDNTTIRSLSTVPEIFANMFVYRPLKGQGTRIDPSYRPVRYLSYALDYQLTRLSPTGYHVSNILYHIIASALVFLVLKRLTGHFGAALAAALLFVVHPVHTESVAYLTGRKDVLCTIFFLLAFLSFLKYRHRPGARHAILLPVFFALAFMAKEMAITLPAVMLLYDLGLYLKEKKGRLAEFARGLLSRSNLAVYLPTVLLALFFGATALLLKNPGGMGDEYVGRWGGSLYISSITMLRGVSHYVRLLFVPLGLSADYSFNAFPVSRSLFDPITTLFSLWLLAALTALGIAMLLKKRFLAGFAILFFFVTLIPVLQIAPLPERLAERFLYLPSVGLMLLAAMGLAWLLKRGGSARSGAIAVTVLLIVVFLALTRNRNADWENPLTLHGSVIARYPDCARSQLAVAESYAMRAITAAHSPAAARHDSLNAIRHFSEVLRILPPETWQGWRRGYALNSLAGRGVAYGSVGKYDKAIRDLEKILNETDVYGSAISDNPDYLHIHFNLGEACFATEKFSEAIGEFNVTIRMAQEKNARDYLARAHLKKALALAGTKKIPEGLQTLLDGAKLAQGTIHLLSLQYHIGLFQLDLDRNEQAIESFRKVIELCERHGSDPEQFAHQGPQSVVLGVDRARRQAYYMIAQALDRSGKFHEALKMLERTVEIAPDYLEARFSLGDFYFKASKLKAAERQFRRVLRERPDDARSKQYLAIIAAKRRAREEKYRPTPQKVFLLHEAAIRDYRAAELEQAQDKLTEALQVAGKLTPDRNLKLLVSRVRLLLGKISYGQARPDAARAHFQAGLDALAGVKPEGAEFQLGEGHYWLGLTLAKVGDNENALLHLEKAPAYLRKAAADSKSSVEAAELLLHSAKANKALGKSNEEFSDYRQVVEILPQYPSISYLAAQAAARAKKAPEAIRLYTKSIEQEVKVVESHYELGRLLFEQGRHTDAALNFQKALKATKDPYYLAACNYELGHAFYAEELYPLAALAWREYLKHEKNPERRKLIEQKLTEDPKLK